MRGEEKAYIAGFLDGDGSITASIEPHRELKAGYRIRVAVKFSQHFGGEPLLQEIRRLMGRGFVSRSRSAAELVIKGKDDVQYVLSKLYPYIRAKKTQAKTAMALVQAPQPQTKAQLKKLARLADRIAEANLQSRSRRKMASTNLPSY